MESARLKREQTKSEPVVRDAQKVRAPVATVSRRPLSLNDAHSPALHLGHAFGPSHSPLSHALQAKLTVNEPGDHYEQEADRVAEQVMRMPDTTLRLQRKCGCGGSTGSGESCQQCANPNVQLQRHSTPAGASSAATAPSIVHDVLRSSGQPVDHSTRAFMEPRFGHDFSEVRVHADAQAAMSAREIGALAFTVGRDIVFGSGEYAPATAPGKRLLAHELAHVVQQRGSVMRRVQRQTIHMESGGFVGQTGGAGNNLREEVLDVMYRLANVGSISSADYYSEHPIVTALPANSVVPTGTIPLTIAAITQNDTPALAPTDVTQLGFTITAAVGNGGANVKADILTLQDVLHVNWHLTNAQYNTERANVNGSASANVPVASIRDTIAGITKLKRAYVGGLHTARFRRQLGVLASALTEVGQLNWVPFNTSAAVSNPSSLQSDFARWALIPGEPAPNSVSGRINCWEMMLLSAFQAGFLTLARIRQIYTRAVDNVRLGRARLVGETVESELRAGRRENILDLGNPRSPQPLAGDMVIFNTAATHAAISLGTLNSAGQHEVLSLFNVPNAISQVQRTTIEALIAAGSATPIRFWSATW